MPTSSRPFAIVTGASSGIGYHLARECAQHGFDLLIAADRPEIRSAAEDIGALGGEVEALEVDLATADGVDALVEAARGRPVDALLANAGHGLGHAFLDQDFAEVRHVIDTNITGTIYLAQQIARQMRERGSGRILFTGSIAGFMPGTFQAVYNGSKAFVDSFSFALRNELKDSGVTVSVLMPGATDTDFFARADMLDTKIGSGTKDDPADVARVGFKAMMAGDGDVVAGLKNKLQVAAANVTPATVLAEMHRKLAEPGSAPQPADADAEK
jgi:short-subunit dehydrogenase